MRIIAKLFFYMFLGIVLLLLVAVLSYFYMRVNARAWPSYAYEANFEFIVEGEQIQLTARQICRPGWWDGFAFGPPNRYQSRKFSVGRSLKPGNAFFVQVPDVCDGRNPLSPLNNDWPTVAIKGPIDFPREDLAMYFADDFESPREFVFLPLDSGTQANEPAIQILRAEWRALMLDKDDFPPVIENNRYYHTRITGKHFEPASPEIRKFGTLVWETSDRRFQVFTISAFSHELYRYTSGWQFSVGDDALPVPIIAKRSPTDVVIVDEMQSRLKYGYISTWRETGFEVFGELVVPNADLKLPQNQIAIFDTVTGDMFFESFLELPATHHVVRIPNVKNP